MEAKAIIYIIGGIIYFLFTMKKKMDEGKKKQQPVVDTNTNTEPVPPKPVTAPAQDPMQEMLREIKRKQTEQQIKNIEVKPKPQPITQFNRKVEKPKELLIKERKATTFGEGNTDEPVYEEIYSKGASNQRGDIRLENEGIYKIQTMEEARAEADEEKKLDYQFDAKQAFLGSVIFERKY